LPDLEPRYRGTFNATQTTGKHKFSSI